MSGKVIAECRPRHRHQEFLAFLRRIEDQVSQRLDVHLIVDNYSTHKHTKVKAWLAKRFDRIRRALRELAPEIHHQVAGADAEFTLVGNLVMFEVPDIDEGSIFFRVLVSDGKTTTADDFRFHVLPAPVRYSIHRIPDTLGDDRVGKVTPSVITNDGHVGGSFEWETELEWYETDPPWPNWTGVIWLNGAPSLTDVNNSWGAVS